MYRRYLTDDEKKGIFYCDYCRIDSMGNHAIDCPNNSKHYTIRVTKKQFEYIAKIIDNDPEPNEELKQLLQAIK